MIREDTRSQETQAGLGIVLAASGICTIKISSSINFVVVECLINPLYHCKSMEHLVYHSLPYLVCLIFISLRNALPSLQKGFSTAQY